MNRSLPVEGALERTIPEKFSPWGLSRAARADHFRQGRDARPAAVKGSATAKAAGAMGLFGAILARCSSFLATTPAIA
jgi:hypothetical protein